jgi:hypothetical protein
MKRAHLASIKISSEESIKLQKNLTPLIRDYGVMETRKEIDFVIGLIKLEMTCEKNSKNE